MTDRPLRRARPPVRRLPRARPRDHARAPLRRSRRLGHGPDAIRWRSPARPRPARHRAGLRRRRTSARMLGGEQFIDLIPHALPARDRSTSTSPGWSRATGGGPTSRRSTTRPTSSSWPAAPARSTSSSEYGVDRRARSRPSTSTTRLAIGAGLDALREAGIPLVQHYRTHHAGKQLPDAVGACRSRCATRRASIFASRLPGLQRASPTRLSATTPTRAGAERRSCGPCGAGSSDARAGHAPRLDRRIAELDALLEKEPYAFDRRFLFRVLSMGHTQFAEYIGARGPNTQVNCRLRRDHAGHRARRGLDPRRPLPPRRRGRRRRRHQRPPDRVDRRRLPRERGRGDRRARRGRRAAVRPPPPRDAHRHGRRRARGREGGRGPRSAACGRSARCSPRSHRQQRLPRHPPGRRAHRQRHGEPGRAGRAPVRRRPPAESRRRRCSSRTRPTPRPAAAAPRPRSTRCGRSSGRRRPDRHRQHQGLHRPPDGRRASRTSSRSRCWRPASCRRCPTSSELDPELGQLNLSKGGRLPGAVRAAPRGRLRVADQHDAAALDPGARRAPTASPTALGHGYRVVDPAAWRRVAARAERAGRPAARGRPAAAARGGPAVGPRRGRLPRHRPVPAAVPAAAPVAPVAPVVPVMPAVPAGPVAPAAAAAPARGGPGGGRGAGGGVGEDRLSAGDAGSGPGSGGGSGRRHGEAGGGVRRDPGDVRRSSGTRPAAAGLPDADACGRVRPGPGHEPAGGRARRGRLLPSRPPRRRLRRGWTRWWPRCCRWWRRRPATRRRCWIWTWIWRRIWGSTR